MIKSWLRGHWRANRGFLLFLLGLGLFRTAVADWNPIPSGSMRPTLLEGDVVLVDRLAYDLKLPLTNIALQRLGEPRRGDVVTFRSPVDGTRLIKRVIGLPGDTVAMRDEQLWINGRAVAVDALTETTEPLGAGTTLALRGREHLGNEGATASPPHAVQFLPEVVARRNFEAVTVPAGEYLVLGDNRDNSADSRYIGLVPRALLIGRAHHVLVSADILGQWRPRLERLGAAID